MASTGNELEGFFSLLFWAVVIGGSVLYSMTKKKRQASEIEATQEQLRLVDEAIQTARARAASPGARASAPAAPPEESPQEGPARPGAWDAEHRGVSGSQQAAELEKPRGALSSAAVRAAAGFAPASHAELQEALAWREIFGPCSGMRP
ncbi:MAG: hypothetical protein AAB074_05470 [Planctomycetota bacterium]